MTALEKVQEGEKQKLFFQYDLQEEIGRYLPPVLVPTQGNQSRW